MKEGLGCAIGMPSAKDDGCAIGIPSAKGEGMR